MIYSTNSHEAQPDSWFVIWTESRAEKKVEARIAALGLSPWLPAVKARHRWNDRWREVVSPLFPGYLFARSRSVEWHKVLRTPGVSTVVKREGREAIDQRVPASVSAVHGLCATPSNRRLLVVLRKDCVSLLLRG